MTSADDQGAVVDILSTLVGFDTTSRNSNLPLIDWVCEQTTRLGARVRRTHNTDGRKANALISIGPDVAGGMVLSAHTDVVPVDGQNWHTDPFTLTRQADRLHGRGSADMKGFIAAILAAMPRWAALDLRVPVHLALSFDEEVGCLGVPLLVRDMMAHVPQPSFVWVGEPTGMRLATAHKGFCLFRTSFEGREAHSSLAHQGVSAIGAAVRFAQHLLDTGALLAYRESRVISELPRHTTFNLGLIEGGSAINIVPRRCALTWEFRPVPDDDAAAIKARIDAFLAHGLDHEFGLASGRGIDHRLVLEVPPLHADAQTVAVRQLQRLLGEQTPISVPFGTEAGFFTAVGLPAVVCGPGDITQAHQPNEFIELGQLLHCQRLMQALGDMACEAPGQPVTPATPAPADHPPATTATARVADRRAAADRRCASGAGPPHDCPPRPACA